MNEVDDKRTCRCCGQTMLTDNLYDGRCLECLEDTIDYYTAFDFLNDKGYFEQFMFERFYESTIPERVSPKLQTAIRERFLRMKNDDQIRGIKDFLDLVKSFILDDDGKIGRMVYADWLAKRASNGK